MLAAIWNGIGGVGRALAILISFLPTFAMTVGPKAAAALEGNADENALPMAIFAAISVPAMALCIYAIHKNKKSAGAWLLFLPLALLLGLVNLVTATESASTYRDTKAAPRKAAIEKAASLKARIEAAQQARDKLPSGPSATTETVKIAKDAAAAAARNTTAECAKVGDNCRLRVADENTAQAALREAQLAKDQTDARRTADAKLDALEQELKDLGPVPLHADPLAVSIAKAVGVIAFPFTAEPPSPDTISAWWPIVLGSGAELLAMLGPTLVLYVFPPLTADERRAIDQNRKIERSAAIRDKRRRVRAKLKKAGGLPNRETVAEWKKRRTSTRPGARIRVGTAYRAYVQWCEDAGHQPVAMTTFALVMRNELGALSVTHNRRSSYHDLALTATPRLVAKAS